MREIRSLKVFRAIRIGVFSAVFICLVVGKFSAQSTDFDLSMGYRRLPKHTLAGDVRLHKNFHSNLLGNSRDLVVYLPPGYDKNKTHRYPVLYMQDGQNIFDVATSFFAGRERHMDEEAQELISQGAIQPLIIVGVYSVGFDRINEYTPTRQANSARGGHADLYGRMLVEELKPFIDSQYRTLKDRSHTSLGGSSLGGLATLYLGLRYSKIFGKLAITSPAAYWDEGVIIRYVRSLPSRTRQRICLSVGTEEPGEFLDGARTLRQALIDKGWKSDVDLSYLEVDGVQHSPDGRAQRVTHLLKFLFPAAK